MNYPVWKKILSYFIEFSIEKSSSEHNPYLEVKLVEGRHQLLTKEAIYSFDDKYENFNYAFKKINWDILEGNRILVLGLGLGSVIYILENKFHKKLDYTAIEIDPEICRLAHQYTLAYIDSFVEVITANGMDFLLSTEEKYDLIIMDIFQSAIIPEIFQTKDYLELLKQKLNVNGFILYNRMNISDTDLESNQQFRNIFLNCFKNMQEIKVKDNLIFISDNKFLK